MRKEERGVVGERVEEEREGRKSKAVLVGIGNVGWLVGRGERRRLVQLKRRERRGKEREGNGGSCYGMGRG